MLVRFVFYKFVKFIIIIQNKMHKFQIFNKKRNNFFYSKNSSKLKIKSCKI